MAAEFVNVDLEVSSSQSLDYLCTEFQDGGARKMFCGPTSHDRFFASFECDEHLTNPNSLISIFLGLVESLDERAAAQWESADSKVFDIGYEADSEQGRLQSDLSPDVIQRVANFGASLRITIYPKTNATTSRSTADRA